MCSVYCVYYVMQCSAIVTKHLFLFHIQILQRISQAVPLAQNSNEQTSSWESFSEIKWTFAEL